MAAPTIPAKYKAIIYDKPGTVSTKVVELDTPEPGPGEVLINLCAMTPHIHHPSPRLTHHPYRSHSGVCHSDFGIMMNRSASHVNNSISVRL